MSFKELGLSEPILQSLEELDHLKPSEIQEQAIPIILAGKNIMAAAQTGTGKTGSFVLPILEMLHEHPTPYAKNAHALILTPTRELAAQVRENVHKYGKFTNIKSTAVFGGAKIFPQKSKLKKGVDILVATPGRLLDLVNQKAVKLDRVKILVLDEADHMLDMGFIHDIKKIVGLLPERRQNLMFTATFSNSFRALAKELSERAIEISVTTDGETGANIEHYVHPVDKSRKAELLIELIETEGWSQALVFTRTKHGADRLQKQLDKVGIKAQAIHGNKTQNNRMKALEAFKNNKTKILVATDVAARGIDIKKMSQVINFDVPTVAKDYIHRIGRTGRGGDEGKAITLVSSDEFRLLKDIEKLLNQTLPRVEVAGFEPIEVVPSGDKKKKKNFNPRAGFNHRTRSKNRKG